MGEGTDDWDDDWDMDPTPEDYRAAYAWLEKMMRPKRDDPAVPRRPASITDIDTEIDRIMGEAGRA